MGKVNKDTRRHYQNDGVFLYIREGEKERKSTNRGGDLMKRVLFVLLVACVLLAAPSVMAIDLQVGTESTFVINRDVDLINLGVEAEYSVQYYDVTVAVPVADWLTITPKAGINHSELDIVSGPAPLPTVEAESGIGWNIGVDVKATPIRTDYVDVAFIGGYRFARTDIDDIRIGALEISNPIETILYTHEWEIGAQVEKNLEEYVGVNITPYIGIVYSDLQGDVDVNLAIVNLDEEIEAQDNFGIRTGVSAEPIENLTLGVDLKFLDQTAVVAKATWSF